MKCVACQLELVESPREHYKSEIHRINVHRQIHNAPPISMEELHSKGASSDVSVEIYNNENTNSEMNNNETSSEKEEKHVTTSKKTKALTCLLCPEDESLEHYLEHGLDADQATYLLHTTCYVCNEGFTTHTSLKDHLDNQKHRTAVLQVNTLVLENGKVLGNKPKSGCSEVIPVKRNGGQLVQAEKVIKSEVEKNEEAKNKLKTSIKMNLQKHFRPDWMQ